MNILIALAALWAVLSPVFGWLLGAMLKARDKQVPRV